MEVFHVGGQFDLKVGGGIEYCDNFCGRILPGCREVLDWPSCSPDLYRFWSRIHWQGGMIDSCSSGRLLAPDDGDVGLLQGLRDSICCPLSGNGNIVILIHPRPRAGPDLVHAVVWMVYAEYGTPG